MSVLLACKPAFAGFRQAWPPGRLHFAAHCRHPLPDISFEAQKRAWIDDITGLDAKWDRVIFADTLPRARRHVARLLHLPDSRGVCFAPSTHELMMRVLSGVSRGPVRVLTTSGEEPGVDRQMLRLEEAGYVRIERIATEPFDSFADRFARAAATGAHDFIYFSHVLHDSGFAIEDLPAIVNAVRNPEVPILIDGHNGFMARPVDLSGIADRAFYLGDGSRSAMSGEGACFMHCPSGRIPRPLDTGFLASLPSPGAGAGQHQGDARVLYPDDGLRFLGAAFDPSGLYRFNAVNDWLLAEGITPERIHQHVWTLQALFLNGLMEQLPAAFSAAELTPPGPQPRGNFLCFRHPRAGEFCKRLQAQQIVTESRGDRLRIGFGIYHDKGDVADLLRRFVLALS